MRTLPTSARSAVHWEEFNTGGRVRIRKIQTRQKLEGLKDSVQLPCPPPSPDFWRWVSWNVFLTSLFIHSRRYFKLICLRMHLINYYHVDDENSSHPSTYILNRMYTHLFLLTSLPVIFLSCPEWILHTLLFFSLPFRVFTTNDSLSCFFFSVSTSICPLSLFSNFSLLETRYSLVSLVSFLLQLLQGSIYNIGLSLEARNRPGSFDWSGMQPGHWPF